MPPRLRLFGVPALDLASGSHDLPPHKPVLLLIYLACRQGWVSRDELVGLFWPEADEVMARHNLRALLLRARRLSWAEGLESDANRLRWAVASDLHEFRDALGSGAATGQRRWRCIAERCSRVSPCRRLPASRPGSSSSAKACFGPGARPA